MRFATLIINEIQEIKLNKLILRKDSSKRIKSGHLWVFSNELLAIPKLTPGTTVELFDFFGVSYGLGFYNPNSLIAVRLLNYLDDIDLNFFKSRIQQAANARKSLINDHNNYRLVYGESDYLPGLIIDKFENSFVLQIQSAGMELNKQLIKKALLELYPETDYIIAKANSKLREIEGLPSEDEVLFGEEPEYISTIDNGIKLELSLSKGQKTGYYLDQRFNRYEIRKLSKCKTVLDCYTNQGGFAMNACIGGAKSVTAVDSSAAAIELAERNANINYFDIDFVIADVFDFLEQSIAEEKVWDIVILDPPAFTKNKKSVPTALAAYSKLNKLGLKVTKNDGYLISSSCSHHISELELIDCIRKEAAKQKKYLKLVFRGTQPADHPELLAMPETSYLKFLILKVENYITG
jgi:23S rRNA (cytosine1962-C5)-methyltransferase